MMTGLYPPREVLRLLKKYGELSDDIAFKMYQQAQLCHDTGARLISLSGDELFLMFKLYEEEKENSNGHQHEKPRP